MERLSFAPASARAPADARLRNVTIAPLTAPLAAGAALQAAVFRLGAGGCLARHPASVPQLLAVIDGEGWVSGANGEREPIVAGEAVFWDAGEEHETSTETGLTAVVVEGERLRPFRQP